MLCAMSHGQLTIDGYIVRPAHLERWTRRQLSGRYASLVGRQALLYGSPRVRDARLPPTSSSAV